MRSLRSRILTIAFALPLMLLAASGALARTCGPADDAGHCCDQMLNCGLACTGTCQPFNAIKNGADPFRVLCASDVSPSDVDRLYGLDPAPELPPPR